MKTINKIIPSVFTCIGLIAGCISIVYSSKDMITYAGYFIIAAAVFDFLDGLFARILNSVSDFGVQLDSLTDIVSFGVAPSMVLYGLIIRSLVEIEPGSRFNLASPELSKLFIMYTAFLVAVFSALRLARFNIDPGQKNEFKGLPVPASGLLIASIGIVSEASKDLPFRDIILNLYFLLGLIIVICFLLVSNIPMFSLKFKNTSFRENSIRYIFLAISAVIIIIFKIPGLAPVVILYILLSVFKKGTDTLGTGSNNTLVLQKGDRSPKKGQTP
jgi:CDP-diacylglycerol--serine O-phosphatidyltransferase